MEPLHAPQAQEAVDGGAPHVPAARVDGDGLEHTTEGAINEYYVNTIRVPQPTIACMAAAL